MSTCSILDTKAINKTESNTKELEAEIIGAINDGADTFMFGALTTAEYRAFEIVKKLRKKYNLQLVFYYGEADIEGDIDTNNTWLDFFSMVNENDEVLSLDECSKIAGTEPLPAVFGDNWIYIK